MDVDNPCRGSHVQTRSPLGRILLRHRDAILDLALNHNVTNVRVFGSVVRGEDDAASDIDLLVDLAAGADLFDISALRIELERLLRHPVDVIPSRLLKPRLAADVLSEAVEL